MNTKKQSLQEIGLICGTDKATYHNYCDFYQKHLHKRTAKIRILEIGVMDGNSLRMWRHYYKNAEAIVGIDISLHCHPIDDILMLQMDATNIASLKTLGNFDLIIDDGSHMSKDQQITFDNLYNHQLNASGLYVMEDLHTSFMPNYINTDITTYDYLKSSYKIIEYNGNEGQSITMIIPK